MERIEHRNVGEELGNEQVIDRIAQIDRAIIAVEERLRLVPGIGQESTQGDDDAVEAEGRDQVLGEIRAELEQLRREKSKLQSILDARQKGQAA